MYPICALLDLAGLTHWYHARTEKLSCAMWLTRVTGAYRTPAAVGALLPPPVWVGSRPW